MNCADLNQIVTRTFLQQSLISMVLYAMTYIQTQEWVNANKVHMQS